MPVYQDREPIPLSVDSPQSTLLQLHTSLSQSGLRVTIRIRGMPAYQDREPIPLSPQLRLNSLSQTQNKRNGPGQGHRRWERGPARRCAVAVASSPARRAPSACPLLRVGSPPSRQQGLSTCSRSGSCSAPAIRRTSLSRFLLFLSSVSWIQTGVKTS